MINPEQIERLVKRAAWTAHALERHKNSTPDQDARVLYGLKADAWNKIAKHLEEAQKLLVRVTEDLR